MDGASHSGRLLLGAVLAVCLLSAVAEARAEGDEVSGLAELARGSLSAGRRALDGMDYERARTELSIAERTFRKVDLREHRDDFLLALGLLAAAHLYAGQESEAKNTLRALLTFDLSWRYPQELRTPKLDHLLDGIRREVEGLKRVTLKVRTSPSDARVALDGRALGETPLSTEAILPGRHVLRVEKPGWRPRQEEVFVGPGTEVDWTLVEDPSAGRRLAENEGGAGPAAERSSKTGSERLMGVEDASGNGPADEGASSSARVEPRGDRATKVERSVPRRSFWQRHRAKVFLGVAVVGAGLTLLAVDQGIDHEKILWTLPQNAVADYDQNLELAKGYSSIANVTLWVTLLSAGVGTFYAITDRRPKEARVSLAPLPGGGVLTLEGSF